MNEIPIKRRSVLVGLGAAAASPAVAAASHKPRVRVRTAKGEFVVALEAERAPITSTNFLRYVDAGKYDGGEFFRSTHPPGAPDQGTLVGRAPLRTHPYPPIPHESTRVTGLRHVAGTISLGRFAPGTATSDFFVTLGPTPSFDAHPGAPGDNEGYAAFGQVVGGMVVVRRIHALPTNGRSPYPDQQGQWLAAPVAILSMRREA